MCKTLTSFTQFNRHNPHPNHPSDFLLHHISKREKNKSKKYYTNKVKLYSQYLYAAAFIINEFFAIFALFLPTRRIQRSTPDIGGLDIYHTRFYNQSFSYIVTYLPQIFKCFHEIMYTKLYAYLDILRTVRYNVRMED